MHNDQSKWYKRKVWQDVAQTARARDFYACCRCGQSPKKLDTDHILPRELAPELSYRLDNLQTLCPSCHKQKQAEEQRLIARLEKLTEAEKQTELDRFVASQLRKQRAKLA